MDSAGAAGVSPRTIREWLERGDNTYQRALNISPERQAAAEQFHADWQEAKAKGEVVRLARAAEWKAKRKAELDAKLDECVDTLLNHGTRGYERKIVTTTKRTGPVTVATTVEAAVPCWKAASRGLEILSPDRFGRIMREGAISLRKREDAGETVISKDQAKAHLRELLGLFGPADIRDIVDGLPIDADEQEPGAE